MATKILAEQSPYRTVRQVARRFSISTRHVSNLVHSGKLKATRLSPRVVRFHVADLDEYERNCQQQ